MKRTWRIAALFVALILGAPHASAAKGEAACNQNSFGFFHLLNFNKVMLHHDLYVSSKPRTIQVQIIFHSARPNVATVTFRRSSGEVETIALNATISVTRDDVVALTGDVLPSNQASSASVYGCYRFVD